MKFIGFEEWVLGGTGIVELHVAGVVVNLHDRCDFEGFRYLVRTDVPRQSIHPIEMIIYFTADPETSQLLGWGGDGAFQLRFTGVKNPKIDYLESRYPYEATAVWDINYFSKGISIGLGDGLQITFECETALFERRSTSAT